MKFAAKILPFVLTLALGGNALASELVGKICTVPPGQHKQGVMIDAQKPGNKEECACGIYSGDVFTIVDVPKTGDVGVTVVRHGSQKKTRQIYTSDKGHFLKRAACELDVKHQVTREILDLVEKTQICK